MGLETFAADDVAWHSYTVIVYSSLASLTYTYGGVIFIGFVYTCKLYVHTYTWRHLALNIVPGIPPVVWYNVFLQISVNYNLCLKIVDFFYFFLLLISICIEAHLVCV